MVCWVRSQARSNGAITGASEFPVCSPLLVEAGSSGGSMAPAAATSWRALLGGTGSHICPRTCADALPGPGMAWAGPSRPAASPLIRSVFPPDRSHAFTVTADFAKSQQSITPPFIPLLRDDLPIGSGARPLPPGSLALNPASLLSCALGERMRSPWAAPVHPGHRLTRDS